MILLYELKNSRSKSATFSSKSAIEAPGIEGGGEDETENLGFELQ